MFDEVQLCERALTSLKYFCEDAPDYHIIVAGSLLGVAVGRAKFSFPVGKVEMKTLYPMDMEEFTLANKKMLKIFYFLCNLLPPKLELLVKGHGRPFAVTGRTSTEKP